MPLIILISIFGFSLLFHFKWKRNISCSVFFSITAIITCLYVFGLFDKLKWGAHLFFYSGILLFLLFVFKEKIKILKILLSIPSLTFILSAILYWCLFNKAEYFFWDEFSHWGLLTKEVAHTNQIYGSNPLHTNLRYPPGAQLWHYFVINNTFYNEAVTYFSHFLILMSSVTALFEKITWRQWPWITLIVSLLAFSFANLGHGFSSIYADHVISCLFTGTLLCFFTNKHSSKNLLLYIFPISTLTLFKDIGLFFACAAIALILVIHLLQLNFTTHSLNSLRVKENKKAMFVFLLLFSSIFAIHSSWNQRQDALDVPKETQSISGIISAWFDNNPSSNTQTQQLIKKRFWHVFYNQQMSKAEISSRYNEFSYDIIDQYTDNFRLSTIGYLFVYIFLCLIAYFLSKDKKQKIIILFSSLLLLSIATTYIAIVYFSYFVAFDDAVRIPSYIRYINTALFSLIILSSSFYFPTLRNQTANNRRFFVAFLLILTLGYTFETPYFKPLYSPHQKNLSHSQLKKDVDDVQQKITKPSKIYIVSPHKDSFLNIIVRYLLYPHQVTFTPTNISQLDSQTLLNTLEKHDYIWIAKPQFQLIKKIESLTGKVIKTPSLFSIHFKENKFQLINIDSLYIKN